MVTFTMNIPPMLAYIYIYHTWILWVMEYLPKGNHTKRCGKPMVNPQENDRKFLVGKPPGVFHIGFC